MAKRMTAAPPDTLAIEREGKVTTWTLYKKPVNGTSSEQEAYARGFRAYVQDFNQGVEAMVPMTANYRKATDQAAYELGYNDAKTSGVITDGRTNAQAEGRVARRNAVDAAAGAPAPKRRRADQQPATRSRRRP
jgi:hypothetical protein